MLKLLTEVRVYLALEPCDMRHQIDGLAASVCSAKARFKTVKYQPDYPGRFRDAAHARAWRVGSKPRRPGWYLARAPVRALPCAPQASALGPGTPLASRAAAHLPPRKPASGATPAPHTPRCARTKAETPGSPAPGR